MIFKKEWSSIFVYFALKCADWVFILCMRICNLWIQKWEGFLNLYHSAENPVGKFYKFAFLRLKKLFFRYFLSYPVMYQTAALVLIFDIKLSFFISYFLLYLFVFRDAQVIFSKIFKILRFIFFRKPFHMLYSIVYHSNRCLSSFIILFIWFS